MSYPLSLVLYEESHFRRTDWFFRVLNEWDRASLSLVACLDDRSLFKHTAEDFLSSQTIRSLIPVKLHRFFHYDRNSKLSSARSQISIYRRAFNRSRRAIFADDVPNKILELNRVKKQLFLPFVSKSSTPQYSCTTFRGHDRSEQNSSSDDKINKECVILFFCYGTLLSFFFSCISSGTTTEDAFIN
jgi:hypothetical protein